jgi:hypothetical protein
VSWWVSVRMCDLGVCSCVATLCLASRATVVWGEKPNRAGKECGAPSGSVLDPSVEVSCEESATALVQLGAGGGWHNLRAIDGGEFHGLKFKVPSWTFEHFKRYTGWNPFTRVALLRLVPAEGELIPELHLWRLTWFAIHEFGCKPWDVVILGGWSGPGRDDCVVTSEEETTDALPETSLQDSLRTVSEFSINKLTGAAVWNLPALLFTEFPDKLVSTIGEDFASIVAQASKALDVESELPVMSPQEANGMIERLKELNSRHFEVDKLLRDVSSRTVKDLVKAAELQARCVIVATCLRDDSVRERPTGVSVKTLSLAPSDSIVSLWLNRGEAAADALAPQPPVQILAVDQWRGPGRFSFVAMYHRQLATQAMVSPAVL